MSRQKRIGNELRADVEKCIRAGMPRKTVAKKFDIGRSTVYRIAAEIGKDTGETYFSTNDKQIRMLLITTARKLLGNGATREFLIEIWPSIVCHAAAVELIGKDDGSPGKYWTMKTLEDEQNRLAFDDLETD